MSTVIKGSASGQINLNDTTGSIQLNGSDVLTIDSSGNLTAPNNLTVTGTVTQTGNATFDGIVGINTSSPTAGIPLTLYQTDTNDALHLSGGNDAGDSYVQVRGDNEGGIRIRGGGSNNGGAIELSGGSRNTDPGVIKFSTGTSSVGTEHMRIDSSGDVLVGTTSKSNIAGVPPNHMFVRSAADAQWTLSLQNTAASGGARGLCINYSGQSPNNTNMEPMFFSDSVNYRFALRSNGGIANYSANNVNISDRREKTNFAPAKSYLQTICSIPVQTFNYIDQNLQEDDGLTLGVVAQDVQAVAPELVTESDWGSDGNPKMRLSVYQTDLTYALMKCIQEQQEIIKALETRIQALESA